MFFFFVWATDKETNSSIKSCILRSLVTKLGSKAQPSASVVFEPRAFLSHFFWMRIFFSHCKLNNDKLSKLSPSFFELDQVKFTFSL